MDFIWTLSDRARRLDRWGPGERLARLSRRWTPLDRVLLVREGHEVRHVHLSARSRRQARATIGVGVPSWRHNSRSAWSQCARSSPCRRPDASQIWYARAAISCCATLRFGFDAAAGAVLLVPFFFRTTMYLPPDGRRTPRRYRSQVCGACLRQERAWRSSGARLPRPRPRPHAPRWLHASAAPLSHSNEPTSRCGLRSVHIARVDCGGGPS